MHRNMLTGCLVAILCVTAVSPAASPDCETLVQPLLDVGSVLGRWALVAGSLADPKSAAVFKERDSITLHLHNSSYVQRNRNGDNCQHYHRNFTQEGHVFSLKVKDFHFNATFLQTSCADCAVISIHIESPTKKSHDIYLLSRKQHLEKKELDEFEAQAVCLNLPPPIFTDPTKELCPEQQTDQQDSS